MKPKATILHNPRCGTSRKALAWLGEHGFQAEIVEYLQSPPSRAELVEILRKLKISPAALIRKKEKLYAEFDLQNAPDDRLIDAMVDHPILIERPVVILGDRAVLARPVENLASLLPSGD